MNVKKPHYHPNSPCLESLPFDEETANQLAGIFKQVGDPTRLKIFWLLCHQEECVTNIAYLLNMSSPAISHHLRSLKLADLIESERKGKEMFYRARSNKPAKLLKKILSQVFN